MLTKNCTDSPLSAVQQTNDTDIDFVQEHRHVMTMTLHSFL